MYNIYIYMGFACTLVYIHMRGYRVAIFQIITVQIYLSLMLSSKSTGGYWQRSSREASWKYSKR